MSKLAPVYIALGSNEGNRLRELRLAYQFLKSINSNQDPKASAIFESAPVGPSSDAYLNAVVRLENCTLAPFELLETLKSYEVRRGRDLNAERWSSRTIDLDILFMGKLVLKSNELHIPHKELTSRNFVLVPLLSLKDKDYGYFSRSKLIQELDSLPYLSLERTHYSWT